MAAPTQLLRSVPLFSELDDAHLDRLADDMLGGSNTAGANRTGSLVLVGPDGTVRAQFLPPFDVELLTAEYLKTRVRK